MITCVNHTAMSLSERVAYHEKMTEANSFPKLGFNNSQMDVLIVFGLIPTIAPPPSWDEVLKTIIFEANMREENWRGKTLFQVELLEKFSQRLVIENVEGAIRRP